MTLDPKLLDRIRKLLALGASPNPNEAASAIAHAQRLMAEHGLSQQDLDAAEIEGHGADDPRMSRASRPPAYETMLINAVMVAFGVDAIRTPYEVARIKFVGRGPQAQVAAYCFVVLLRQLAQARMEFMRGEFETGVARDLFVKADHFAEGWVTAVVSLIDRVFLSEREQTAIATWMQRQYPKSVRRSGRDAGFARGGAAAAAAGYDAGRKAQLHRSMHGAAVQRRIAR